MSTIHNEDSPMERTVLAGMPGYYALRLAMGIASEDEAEISRRMLDDIDSRDRALAELRSMGVEITDDDRSPQEILVFLKDMDARRAE